MSEIETELQKLASTFDGALVLMGHEALRILNATVAHVPSRNSSAARAGFRDIRVTIVEAEPPRAAPLNDGLPEFRSRWVVCEAIDGTRLHRVGLRVTLPHGNGLTVGEWYTTPDAIGSALLWANDPERAGAPLLLQRRNAHEKWPALPHTLTGAFNPIDWHRSSGSILAMSGFDLELLSSTVRCCSSLGSGVRMQWPVLPGDPLRFDVIRKDVWFTATLMPMTRLDQVERPLPLDQFLPTKAPAEPSKEEPAGSTGSGASPPFPGGG